MGEDRNNAKDDEQRKRNIRDKWLREAKLRVWGEGGWGVNKK